jgi:hypothetical protein
VNEQAPVQEHADSKFSLGRMRVTLLRDLFFYFSSWTSQSQLESPFLFPRRGFIYVRNLNRPAPLVFHFFSWLQRSPFLRASPTAAPVATALESYTARDTVFSSTGDAKSQRERWGKKDSSRQALQITARSANANNINFCLPNTDFSLKSFPSITYVYRTLIHLFLGF